MKRTIANLILIFSLVQIQAQIPRQLLDFEFEGLRLSGVLNMPEIEQVKGIILIVHGSGQTKAVAQEWYYDVRETFVQSGYAAYMWDKRGCGKSEGSFDYNQSVQNSAEEVIAAINNLKEKEIPGADDIALWGISRAGWINPLVIEQQPDIKFWISVSGVDEKENFKYLLEQNLRIDGHSEASISTLLAEWVAGTKISHAGGSYEAYQAATSNLRENEFMLRFTNGAISEDAYYSFQKQFMQEELEQETSLQIYIQNFDQILSKVKCPVLALFGEKDMNVDWIQTKRLYENTLGLHTDLQIQSFPDCNHNLFQCKTGGFYEFEDNNLAWNRCEGFLEAMANWLKKIK